MLDSRSSCSIVTAEKFFALLASELGVAITISLFIHWFLNTQLPDRFTGKEDVDAVAVDSVILESLTNPPLLRLSPFCEELSPASDYIFSR